MNLTLPLATWILSGLLGQAYPRPELIMEADDLAKAKTEFLILDARTQSKYDASHIPGAIWVDHDNWNKAFAAQQDPKTWSERIGKIGVSPSSKVVIYDDAMQKDAARIWWILRYYGLKDARLLNGGWQAWNTSGRATSKDPETAKQAMFPIVSPDARRLADKSIVLDLVKEKKGQIIDARSADEFCGDQKLAKRGGHIPGAHLLEWKDALDPVSKKFKSPTELQKIFKDAGIDLNQPAVTHCQSGGRASVMAFTLELMGAKEVANYYRGWSEWGNDAKTPVALPPKK